MSIESDSRSSPFVIMILPRFPSKFQTPLSVHGRPSGAKCEYARFPDEAACKEEIKVIERAVKEERDNIPNRHYDMRDVRTLLKRFYLRPHAWK